MKQNRYVSNIAFIDLLFNITLGFVFLFVVAFILINDPTKAVSHVDPKAEYVVILRWENDHNIDLDLWVEGPDGITNFLAPQRGVMYLDKDDLGQRNDRITLQDGTTTYVPLNQEIINIRGFNKGEYVVNTHYYKHHTGPVITKATLEVIKLNPYSKVFLGSKEFSIPSQEVTFVRFDMDKDGRYSEVNTLPKSLVRKVASLPSESEPDLSQLMTGMHATNPSYTSVIMERPPPGGPPSMSGTRPSPDSMVRVPTGIMPSASGPPVQRVDPNSQYPLDSP